MGANRQPHDKVSTAAKIEGTPVLFLDIFPRGRIFQVCQTKAAQNSGRSLRLPPNSPLTQASSDSSNSPLSQGTASCRCSLATDTLAHAHAAGWPRAQAWGLSGQSSSKANINTQYTNIGTQRKASSGPEFYLLFFKSFWFSDKTKYKSS